MDPNDNKRQELIAGAIAAGIAARDAWIHPWKQLSNHLKPLIGDSGFAALFRRSVRLVSTEYDWISSSAVGASADDLIDGLGGQLTAVDAGKARDANAALLSIFTKLLSGLIGEALTFRLLNSAWNVAAGESTNAREQT